MDLDTVLRETAAVPDPAPAVLAASRATMLEQVNTSNRTVVRLAGRKVRRSRVLVVAALAGAASLALVLGPTLQYDGSRPTASAEAAELLRRAGKAAGEQPGGWPDAAYWHSVSQYSRSGQPAVRREIWIGHHAPGVLRDGGVSPGLLPLEVGRFAAGGRGLTWDQLYALPTDAAALESELRAGINGAGPDDDSEMFVIVGDLLRESPAPPALRKALWEVAARVPGVQLVGPTVDSAGRPGVAVERGDTRYTLDPNDGRLLEESQAGTGPAGVPAWRTTYLEQGPAATAPKPADGGPSEKR